MLVKSTIFITGIFVAKKDEKITLCRILLEITEDVYYEKEVPECRKDLYEFVTGHEVDMSPF